MKIFEEIIEKWDWKLKIFASRYGSGYWVTLLPNKPYSDEIEERITGGDCFAMPMIRYLESEGVWMPTVLAGTIEDALLQLERKVSVLSKQSNWYDSVCEAVDELIDGEITYSDIQYTQNLETVLLQPFFVELLNSK